MPADRARVLAGVFWVLAEGGQGAGVRGGREQGQRVSRAPGRVSRKLAVPEDPMEGVL